MPVVNPKAAGVDVGSRSFFVCVGQGPEDVREFGVFTCDLHNIAYTGQYVPAIPEYLCQCKRA
jgi:hypothetical protein